ncbi:MAG: (d)CMP kinase [Planctomyces sp.]|jgi:cytidylate kinase
MIITIDGPAGSGKSTVARQVASLLQVRFLDTGAMYRAAALAVRQAGVPADDRLRVASVVNSLSIEFHGSHLLLNQQDVTSDIRSPEVTAISSIVASHPEVREKLVEQQRAIGRMGSLVTEGRDQGTVVFPDAEFKFFMTADLDARADRRYRELVHSGKSAVLEEIRRQLEERDERDRMREHAPMKPAPDAIQIDTSHQTIDEVVQSILNRVRP